METEIETETVSVSKNPRTSNLDTGLKARALAWLKNQDLTLSGAKLANLYIAEKNENITPQYMNQLKKEAL